MALMDYFRRPILAGKNTNRLSLATVYGSLRRSNADGTSAVPYFPAASSTQTINITTDASSVVATLAGNSLTQVLAALNTALGSTGKAFDADGVVGIQTSTTGGTGFIEVTGGTASTAVGFDTTLGRKLRATGGDAPSAPEGRRGNPFGTTFLGSSENLLAGSIQRAQAVFAANLDVLYADASKEDAVVQKVATFTVDGAAGKFITFPAGTRLYNGYYSPGTFLSSTSVAADLAPYYAIVDATTRQLTPYKVVGLVTGTTTADPPYTNATNLADTGKNALGLNLSKFGPTAITAVRDGRVVTSTAAGTNSVVGDVGVIVSATNNTPWSNNGMKWIVEQVIDANNIVLRPASQAELIMLGVTLTDTQPVLELNDNSLGGAYGNLQLFTGPFSTGCCLVVRPQLPVGGSYEVWAAMPSSLRGRHAGVLKRGDQPRTTNPSPFRSGSDSIVQLQAVRNTASQTADIFQVLAENGSTVLSSFTTKGALVVAPDGTNTTAITASGIGTGNAITATAGLSGIGVQATGGSLVANTIGLSGIGLGSVGHGVKGAGNSAGTGGWFIGGTSGTGVDAYTSWNSGAAVTGQNTGSGNGLGGDFYGGATGRGARGTGFGAAAGLQGIGGASGPGVVAQPGDLVNPVRGTVHIEPTTNPPSTPTDGDTWVTSAGILGVKLNGNNRTVAVLQAAQSFTATQTFSGITLGTTALYQPATAALTWNSSGTGTVSGNTAITTTYATITTYQTSSTTTNMTASTGAGSIQVTNAGTYMVSIFGSFANTNTVGTNIWFRIFKNGTTALGAPDDNIFLPASTVTTFRLAASSIAVLAASDTIVLQARDSAGTSYNISFNSLSFTVNRVF